MKIMATSANQRSREQTGVVSIMVTMVMLIVISLIVLGFAEISRNEQRNSLDQQLSVQAYYAAESGVNDARAAIADFIKSGSTVPAKTSCDNGSSGYTLNGVVGSDPGIAYTCVLIDPTPAALDETVGYTSTVVPIISDGSNFGTITLTWRPPAGITGAPAGCYTSAGSLDDLPVASGSGAWACAYPMLRVDLLDANGALQRGTWNQNTTTAFFVPFNSNSMANRVSLGAHGTMVPANCSATSCTADIRNMNGTKYYMRVTTLYQTNSKLTITSSGHAFADAQATIDATGKARDVLRRILVSVDLTDANTDKAPSAALITEDSVCKRFATTRSSFDVYDDLTAGGGGNPLCDPASSGGTPAP